MLGLLFTSGTPGTTQAAPAPADDPPVNIVLIIGDDHAWFDAGFLGHEIALTPNLDRIAAAGTVFHNAHNTASTCVPSLRTLLSGLHPVQWEERVAELERRHGRLPRRTEARFLATLPRLLSFAGYVSFEGGKMWEGTFAHAGFTAGMATEIGSLYRPVGFEFGRDGIEPFREFLDATEGNPFFAWLAPMLPHKPHDAAAAFREPFEGRGLSEDAIGYYASLLRLDAVVGEVVAELENRDLLSRTLLVYLSDNGWEIGQLFGESRDGKSSLYELGVRTPLIFQLPGVVPAGVVREDLVSTEDLVPTLLEAAGLRPPRGLPGRSLLRGMLTAADVGRSRIVSEQTGTQHAPAGVWIRTPSWRYVNAADRAEELYAIVSDPGETTNLASRYPGLLSWFRAEHLRWRRDLSRGASRGVACTQQSRDARTCMVPRRAPHAVRADGMGVR